MLGSKYGKMLTIGLVIGIVAVLGVLTYFTVDFIKNTNDSAEASEEAELFENSVKKSNKKDKNVVNEEVQNTQYGDVSLSINAVSSNVTLGSTTPTDSSSSTAKTYKGFPVVGTISIPKTNINLPILGYVSAKAIDASVAMQTGSVGLNQIGNTTIIGHNYRDGRFFANNKNLANGDKVYITDESGNKIEYTIYNIYTTAPEDSDFMNRDTNGKREITLDTCTDDAQSRLIIWAKEK